MGLGEGKFSGQRLALLHLSRSEIEKRLIVSRRLKHHNIAQELEQASAKKTRVVARVENAVQLEQRGARIAPGDG